MSNRAALVAVVTAFFVGIISSLALRPATRPIHTGETHGGETIRWRMPSAFGTNLPVLGDNVLDVSAQIAAASGGRLQLEVFEPGEVVPAFAIVDAVREGKIQAGYTWLGYDQGRLPASVLFGAVPFGMSPWEYSAWWYEGEGWGLAAEIYGAIDIHPLLCGLIGPETAGWFRAPIEHPEDMAGLKIRFAGLGGKAIQRLGASVTMLPGGEIFQALEKGAIDATEFSLPVVDQRLGFDRVANFNYFPGWHQPSTAFHLVVGRQAWRDLQPDSRALIENACTAGVTRNLARAEALQGPVLREFEARGVETRILSDEILLALKRESEAVLDEEAARDRDFARVLASQRAFSESYDRWRRIAYPPRP
jgi:TRAP-type mannitol/chloroaromatic compound transport system substrate-binding protein